jgi:hypothetical protein
MKSFLLTSAIILITITELRAQLFVPSVSNTLRYGNGKRSLGIISEDFKYFENLTDVRIQLPENFTAGFRLLYDIPPEVGLEFKGIKRRFIEYDGSNFYARLGDFSQLYGRGLALNLFENRGLGYDTWMDGVNAKYMNDYFNVSIVYGTLDFKDSIVIARDEIHKLRGGTIEVTPISDMSVGLTYVYSRSSLKLFGESKELEINLPSIYVNYSFSDFTFLFDYANKETKNKSDKQTSSGAAYYSALSFNKDGLGIALDYKNYFFDERDPFEKNDITRTTRMMPFQNPPIVMKEHSYTLLTRAIHEVDFNDETGLQLEIFKTLNENVELNFNGSISSRHSFYIFDQNLFTFSKQERSSDFLPSFSKEYSPYWELFGEVVYYFSETTYMKLALARRNKVFYDEIFGGLNNHIIKSTILPLQINHTFSSIYSFEGQVEYEQVFDNFNVQQKYFNNFLLTLINTFASRLTISIRYESTNNRFDVSERTDWITFETGFRITQGNTVVASYGRERGGQVCSNGVCRYIQPFEGFRFSLITNI